MGKTETIRQRRVDVWVPTLEAKQEWKEYAAKQGMSLSKAITQIMQEAVSGPTATAGDVEDLNQRILDLETELEQRDRRIKDLEALKERLEDDLDQYRTQDFLQPDGMKILDHRLISILADAKGHDGRQRVVPQEEILRRMRIAPGSQKVQAVAKQLEALELYGVVRATSKGWIWHE